MKTIGKYIIRGLLGRGGMSRIYKVEHPVIGKILALKHLDPDPLLVRLMGMEDIRAMFVAEAVTMAGLRHPNIVEIFDFDEVAGRPFYLMAYFANNLRVMIGESNRPDEPSRPLPVEKAIRYTRHTLQGLACLHHSGIVHRDIKPANLLITDQDAVKICDFGLSKLHGEKFRGPPSLKVGSAWYAPPEQETDPDDVDARADLFSVGLTFYRLLTGVLPPDSYRPVGRFNADLDEDWDDFIQTAAAPRVRDRFGSAPEMLAALDALARSWQSANERICRLRDSEKDHLKPEITVAAAPLRRDCLKVDPRQASNRFPIDRLRRPRIYHHRNFERSAAETVTDGAARRLWQQAGSPFQLSWPTARAYIERLNTEGFAGHRDWRLPTIDELITLLTDIPRVGDDCLAPVFAPGRPWLWSCDRRSFTAAWYVSTDMGFVAWQDFSAPLYVRAVRNLS
ncbi:MAG: protein kinase [Desulfobacterales bacterium]